MRIQARGGPYLLRINTVAERNLALRVATGDPYRDRST